jgi:sec-independent protein translocase protein TatA
MAPGFLAPSHIILFAVVALLIFGPKRLPEIARSLGHGMREFKDTLTGDHADGTELPGRARIAPDSVASTVREHDTV